MRAVLLTFIFLFTINFLAFAQGNLTSYSNEDLNQMATDFYYNGDIENAMLYWTELRNRAKERGLDSLYISSMSNIGVLYEETGDFDQAEKIYLEAKELALKSFGEIHIISINTITNLAFLAHAKGDYKTAEPYYKQALDFSRSAKDKECRALLGQCMVNLGVLYHDLGKLEAAEQLYLGSNKELKHDTGPLRQENYATGLSNLATLYSDMGRYEEALDLELEALDLRKKSRGTKTPDYALSLRNVAAKYVKIGKLEEAEPLMIEGKNLEKKILGVDNARYAGSVSNLAILYGKKRQFAKSKAYHLEAMEIRKRVLGENHRGYANSLNSLANTYRSLGDFDKAEKYALEAASIAKKINGERHPLYVSSLNNLASLYKEKKQYQTSEAMYLKALEIDMEYYGPDNINVLKTLANLGELYHLTNDREKAITMFNRALYGNCQVRTVDLEEVLEEKVIALGLLEASNMDFRYNNQMMLLLLEIYSFCDTQFDLSKDGSYLKQAYKSLNFAMQVNEKERNTFSGEQNKLRTLKTMSLLVAKAISCGVALAEEDAKQKLAYLEDAFYYAEQNKSILLSDAIKGNRAKILGDLPDSLALKELSLEKRKSKLQKKVAIAKSDKQRHAIFVKQNELNLEIDAFLESLKNKYPNYHALKYENIIAKSNQVQALLDDKTLVLEYFVSNDKTYLFIVSKDNLELLPIDISKEELSKEVKQLREALSNYKLIVTSKDRAYNSYIKSAYWFYENMLEEALKGKDIENLIVIADGELGHIPFESFLVSPGKAQNVNYINLDYLVNHYNVSYNYSATLWKTNKEAAAKSNNNKILACASEYPSSEAWGKGSLDSIVKELRPLTEYKMRTHLNPLPAAQKEVAALVEHFQGDFLQGDMANEAFFKSNGSKYGVIHLAMHGLLHARVPMLSSLAFTENKDSLEDNFLQAYEISQLKLNADLVVLSACETGFGKFEQGEGVISLARSFMYAGVPSLVVSLWQVNDNSTAVIMDSFYQNLSKGLSKDVALRQAKLTYLKNAQGIAAHPAFWSPFIQLGDNRPIKLATKGGWLPWGLGLLAFGIVIGGFAYSRKKVA